MISKPGGTIYHLPAPQSISGFIAVAEPLQKDKIHMGLNMGEKASNFFHVYNAMGNILVHSSFVGPEASRASDQPEPCHPQY